MILKPAHCPQATTEILKAFSTSVQGLKDGKRVSHRNVGALVALVMAYMYEEERDKSKADVTMIIPANRQDYSLYSKTVDKIEEAEMEAEMPDLIASLSENIRNFIGFCSSCTVKKIENSQANHRLRSLQHPLDKALEVTSALRIFCLHTTNILEWAETKGCDIKVYKKAFHENTLHELPKALLACEQTIQQGLNNTYVLKKLSEQNYKEATDEQDIPVVRAQPFNKGGLYMKASTVQFLTTENVIQKIIEGVHYQIADVMDDHDEFAVIEEHYGEHLCLTGPGVAVLNFEYSTDVLPSSLIFIVTQDINVYSTDFGLSLVATVENRAQLIQWLTENLDDYGKLSEEKNEDFATYEDVTALLNALA